MHSQRWKRKSTVVFNIGYQLIWCTKYRRRVLAKDVEKRLKDLPYLKAEQINVEIVRMEVMPDNIHLFVKAEPAAPPDCHATKRAHVTNPKQQKTRFFVQLLPKQLVIPSATAVYRIQGQAAGNIS